MTVFVVLALLVVSYIPKGTTKGITLTPNSAASNDFTYFMNKIPEVGTFLTTNGKWTELSDPKGAPVVISTLASKYHYTPIVIANIYDNYTAKIFPDYTETNYEKSVTDFANKYKPKYLGLGNELNIFNEQSPADFERFATTFDRTYDGVKEVSPNTQIFVVFQLERLMGLKGGLFGGINDGNQNEWALLGKFPKADIIAFTTYPGFIYKKPSEIPVNFYTDIRKHTVKPIAFSEIGWATRQMAPGWTSTEADQGDYIDRFFTLTKGLNVKFNIWSFMYDQKLEGATNQLFGSMGLLNANNSPRIGWDKWVSAK